MENIPEARSNPWNGHALNCACAECVREAAWYTKAAEEQQREALTQKWHEGLRRREHARRREQISWEERAAADVLKMAEDTVAEDVIRVNCPTCRRDFGTFRVRLFNLPRGIAAMEVTPVCQGCIAEGR